MKRIQSLIIVLLFAFVGLAQGQKTIADIDSTCIYKFDTTWVAALAPVDTADNCCPIDDTTDPIATAIGVPHKRPIYHVQLFALAQTEKSKAAIAAMVAPAGCHMTLINCVFRIRDGRDYRDIKKARAAIVKWKAHKAGYTPSLVTTWEFYWPQK